VQQFPKGIDLEENLSSWPIEIRNEMRMEMEAVREIYLDTKDILYLTLGVQRRAYKMGLEDMEKLLSETIVSLGKSMRSLHVLYRREDSYNELIKKLQNPPPINKGEDNEERK
jgi:hypothetical protein